MKASGRTAFSLVEVTIAIGVVSFSLLTLFALIPIGLKENQTSASQTAATSVLTKVIADLRAAPKANVSSGRFGITYGTSTTVYFDSEGSSGTALTSTSRYRCTINFPPSPPGGKSATFVDVKVTWPAAAAVTDAAGSCEMFAAFDRH
jgi:uncharacterized protein (TIGR02598 family)